MLGKTIKKGQLGQTYQAISACVDRVPIDEIVGCIGLSYRCLPQPLALSWHADINYVAYKLPIGSPEDGVGADRTSCGYRLLFNVLTKSFSQFHYKCHQYNHSHQPSFAGITQQSYPERLSETHTANTINLMTNLHSYVSKGDKEVSIFNKRVTRHKSDKQQTANKQAIWQLAMSNTNAASSNTRTNMNNKMALNTVKNSRYTDTQILPKFILRQPSTSPTWLKSANISPTLLSNYPASNYFVHLAGKLSSAPISIANKLLNRKQSVDNSSHVAPTNYYSNVKNIRQDLQQILRCFQTTGRSQPQQRHIEQIDQKIIFLSQQQEKNSKQLSDTLQTILNNIQRQAERSIMEAIPAPSCYRPL